MRCPWSGKEQQVLEIVGQRGRTSLGHVARRMEVSPEYAEDTVQELVEQEYLQETAEKHVYRITGKTRRLLEGLGRIPVSRYPIAP